MRQERWLRCRWRNKWGRMLSAHMHDQICSNEQKCKVPGDIGIWHTQNDRIIHAWQISAGSCSDATVDAYLSAIRFMEDFLGGKSFAALTAANIDAVRSELKSQFSRACDAPKSRSSVSHTASQIRKFLERLL